MSTKPETKLVDLVLNGINGEVELDPDRRSNLDLDGLLAVRESELFGPLDDAKPKLVTIDDKGVPRPDPSLPLRHDAYVGAVRTSLQQLAATKGRHELATSAARRYVAEAYDHARAAHVVFVQHRERINKRIPQTKVGKEIREACGVGANVPDEVPRTVSTRSHLMLAAFENADFADTFTLVDVDTKLLGRQLRVVLEPLDAALAKSPSEEKKGEVTPELQKALLRVDVAFQRLFAFLEDHGARGESAVVNGRLPRKVARRVGDVKVEGGGEAGPLIATTTSR